MSRVLNVFFENHSFMYVRLIMESVRSFFSNFQVLWKLKWSSQKYNQVRNRRMSMTSVHLVKTLWQLIYSKTDGSCYFHIASFHLTRTKKNKRTNIVNLQYFNIRDEWKEYIINTFRHFTELVKKWTADLRLSKEKKLQTQARMQSNGGTCEVVAIKFFGLCS